MGHLSPLKPQNSFFAKNKAPSPFFWEVISPEGLTYLKALKKFQGTKIDLLLYIKIIII